MAELNARPAPKTPGSAETRKAPLLELSGITKRFSGVTALDGMSLSLWPGEVHVLMGENGAGKSTLMKVLCGAHEADDGKFFSNGAQVTLGSTGAARALGVSVIFQEFTLVPHLSVARNIFLGREPVVGPLRQLDHRKMHADARRLLDRLAVDLDTRLEVHSLSTAQQQLVEIAKALSVDARILVLDEPTAALSDRESERLFALIRELKARGVAMVYISHRMAEVFSIGDRVTVIRDGRHVATMLPGQTSPDQLVSLMVGRKVDTNYSRSYCHVPGPVVADVRQVVSRTGLRDVSLKVHRGEIVGLTGLVGSGRTELARAVFGADPIESGSIELFGEPAQGGPHQRRALGVALVPESRKTQGLALEHSVHANLMVSALGKHSAAGFLQLRRAARTVQDLIHRLSIATSTAGKAAGKLSGGNQQKIVIGKWLAAQARLYILDEPTRGIDVGAKEEVFRLVDKLVKQGASVLMISSELHEIVQVCDRAYVMREGRIAGHLGRDQLREQAILSLAMNHA